MLNNNLKVNGADNSAEKNNRNVEDLKMVNNKNFNGVNVLSDEAFVEVVDTCAVCGKALTENDNFKSAFYKGSEETICDDCLFDNKDGYEFCDSCQCCYCLKPSSELHLVYGVGDGIEEYYTCDKYMDLYIECEHCGRDFYVDDITHTDDNKPLCPECYEEYLESEEYEED